MFFHNFNIKSLSDEALLAKQQELSAKLYSASATTSPQVAAQISQLIDAISTERQERLYVSRFKQIAKQSVAIETDPDLAQAMRSKETNSKSDTQNGSVQRNPRKAQRSLVPIPTATPVTPSEKPNNTPDKIP